MAYDYALVHLKFTIPPAVVLTALAYPLLTRRHWYQTAVLVAIAVVATIPWDSYLIRHRVWTYPPDAVLGPTFLSIPAEELFFFVVQTYITSLLYHLANKPLLHAAYLRPPPPPSPSRTLGRAGVHRPVQGLLLGLALLGLWLVAAGGPGTYMGLILAWAGPFALLTWTLGGRFVAALPWTSTVLPVALATLYLWAVDEGALRRGTWAIASGTKLGVALAGRLEAEEAVFFLATNVLVVLGLGAFDNALAVVDALPDAFGPAPACPAPATLVRALFVTWTEAREARVRGIQEAVERLCRKSRSFYLASSTFTGRLRIDLVHLYSYCRMADDLIDEPPEGVDPAGWIGRLAGHLDLVYKPGKTPLEPGARAALVRAHIEGEFPAHARSALALLPTALLPPAPLYLLLDGFRTDSTFPPAGGDGRFPIADERCLRAYGSQVAGTVGQLCLSLIAHHSRNSSTPIDPARLDAIAAAAARMGIALQYVNIARDIAVDAALGRVYLPTTWLAEAGLTPALVVATITGNNKRGGAHDEGQAGAVLAKLVGLRRRLLDRAFAIYAEARPTMDGLPGEARRPMIVAVESYMEIGRVLLEREGLLVGEASHVQGRPGRATVPRLRRLKVALRALLSA